MPNNQEPELKYYWLTMKFEPQYRLLVPAISPVESVILADEMEIPTKDISIVEKDVVDVEEMKPV